MLSTRVLASVAALGGLLLCVGAVLDWSGVDYSSTLDRRLAFVAGGVAILAAAAAVAWRRRALALAIAGAALGLNMAVVNYRDIANHEFEYAAYPDASVGVGIYLLFVGAALALAAGIAALRPRARRRRTD